VPHGLERRERHDRVTQPVRRPDDQAGNRLHRRAVTHVLAQRTRRTRREDSRGLHGFHRFSVFRKIRGSRGGRGGVRVRRPSAGDRKVWEIRTRERP
jgi:hypothetical protein